MQNFIDSLEKKSPFLLKKMHFHAKGYEKDIIESVLIKKMYNK